MKYLLIDHLENAHWRQGVLLLSREKLDTKDLRIYLPQLLASTGHQRSGDKNVWSHRFVLEPFSSELQSTEFVGFIPEQNQTTGVQVPESSGADAEAKAFLECLVAKRSEASLRPQSATRRSSIGE